MTDFDTSVTELDLTDVETFVDNRNRIDLWTRSESTEADVSLHFDPDVDEHEVTVSVYLFSDKEEDVLNAIGHFKIRSYEDAKAISEVLLSAFKPSVFDLRGDHNA